MSASNVNNEKPQRKTNPVFPGYPDLPPPYSSVVPQTDIINDNPKVPTSIVPTAPQEPSLTEKHNDGSNTEDNSVRINGDDNDVKPIDFKPIPMHPHWNWFKIYWFKIYWSTCPSCKAEIKTRTDRHPTLRTHACACLLFWMIWWPCICLPYCLPGCNNVDHYCPNCDSYIGGFKC